MTLGSKVPNNDTYGLSRVFAANRQKSEKERLTSVFIGNTPLFFRHQILRKCSKDSWNFVSKFLSDCVILK